MSRSTLLYVIFAGFVLVVGMAGYGIYHFYPRFDLPVLYGVPLTVLAAGAGLASFFSPCAFPLLLAFLAGEKANRSSEHSPWRFAFGLATGAGLFLLLLGGVFLAGGMAFARNVTFGSTVGIGLRVVMGGLFMVLGLVQVGWISDRPFRMVQRRVVPSSNQRHEIRPSFGGLVTFGFGYILAGFG